MQDNHTTATPPAPPTVLFLCVHNAGRSQMALGWLRALAGHSITGLSAGSEPADRLNPQAIEAMREVGIDIAGEQPKRWTEEMLGSVNLVITMGCGDSCPVYPGVRYIDWEIDDPAGQPLDEVRRIRYDIGRRVQALVRELGVTPSEGAEPSA